MIRTVVAAILAWFGGKRGAAVQGDPFAAFDEWDGKADSGAYRNL
jgi:hypothetical protein